MEIPEKKPGDMSDERTSAARPDNRDDSVRPVTAETRPSE
jgi:hypothetical protein